MIRVVAWALLGALSTLPAMAQVEIRGLTVAPPDRPGTGGIMLKSLLSTRLPGEIVGLRQHAGRVLARLDNGQTYRLTLREGELAREPVLAPDHGPPTADSLPDTEVTGSGDIEAAWLIGPTDRLRHGALGDAIEATGFRLRWRSGAIGDFRLEAPDVFEDRRVRLADVDGDGRPEALLVRSSPVTGAALAIYRLQPAGIALLAQSAPFGQANRWLNPVGIGDIDGDGKVEIVLVQRPHLDGRLAVLRMEDGVLREIAAIAGFSNHRLGRRFLGLSALVDVTRAGRPQIVVAGIADDCLHVLALEAGGLREIGTLSCGASFVGDFIVADVDGDAREDLIVAREKGRIEIFLR
jgi:hypothetical protein